MHPPKPSLVLEGVNAHEQAPGHAANQEKARKNNQLSSDTEWRPGKLRRAARQHLPGS
jgi:hypothetical protein